MSQHGSIEAAALAPGALAAAETGDFRGAFRKGDVLAQIDPRPFLHNQNRHRPTRSRTRANSPMPALTLNAR